MSCSVTTYNANVKTGLEFRSNLQKDSKTKAAKNIILLLNMLTKNTKLIQNVLAFDNRLAMSSN